MVGGFALVLGAGCGDDNPVSEEPDVFSNPNPPNANALIVDQKLIGDPDRETSLWEIIDAGDGGFYFSGDFNDRYALGKLDETGDELWKFRMRYAVKDHIRVAGLSGALENCLLTTGGADTDFDGNLDIGYVTLFSNDGTLLEELLVSSESASLSLLALDVAETAGDLAQVVVVGSAESEGEYYPYLVRLTVAQDGTLQMTDEKVFSAWPGKFFRNIQIDRDQSPARYYVQGDDQTEDGEYGDQTIYRVSDDLTITWSQDVVPEAGLQSWTTNGGGFSRSENSLFLTGSTEIEKATSPDNGGYWDAGFVARATTDGSTDWVKSITLSQYSERLLGCTVSDNALYVTGSASRFFRQVEGSRIWYANAVVLKIDPETGNRLADWTFGDEGYFSHFNDVMVRDDKAYAVGYTKYVNSARGYQGWFVIIDLGAASLATPGPSSQIPEGIDGLPAYDGRRETAGDRGAS
jgi:hypothetical protein